MIDHPIKIAYSIFLIALGVGVLTAGNQHVSKFMIPIVVVTGIAAVLTQIWWSV